jgi:hypothetical protein
VSGAHGSIAVTNRAPTLLQTGAINTWGPAGAPGGDVSLVSAGNITSAPSRRTAERSTRARPLRAAPAAR